MYKDKNQLDWKLIDDLIMNCYMGAEIARRLNISTTQFYYAIKTKYRMNFSEYYLSVRNTFLSNYN